MRFWVWYQESICPLRVEGTIHLIRHKLLYYCFEIGIGKRFDDNSGDAPKCLG